MQGNYVKLLYLQARDLGQRDKRASFWALRARKPHTNFHTMSGVPGLALLRGLQDRNMPLTCGAKGTRIPGLLDAKHGRHRGPPPPAPGRFGCPRSYRPGVVRSGCCTSLLYSACPMSVTTI